MRCKKAQSADRRISWLCISRENKVLESGYVKGVPFGNRSEAILKGTFKKMIHKKGDGLDLGAELPRIKRIESPL